MDFVCRLSSTQCHLHWHQYYHQHCVDPGVGNTERKFEPLFIGKWEKKERKFILCDNLQRRFAFFLWFYECDEVTRNQTSSIYILIEMQRIHIFSRRENMMNANEKMRAKAMTSINYFVADYTKDQKKVVKSHEKRIRFKRQRLNQLDGEMHERAPRWIAQHPMW